MNEDGTATWVVNTTNGMWTVRNVVDVEIDLRTNLLEMNVKVKQENGQTVRRIIYFPLSQVCFYAIEAVYQEQVSQR